MTASSQLLDSQVMSYTTFSVYIWAISVFRYNENIYIMRLDSVSAMHFLSLIKVCIQIVWCIAIRPWLLVPLKPLSNTVHHWMLSLPKENFLPSVFCSILFSRIKEGYQNSHNSRILKVWVLGDNDKGAAASSVPVTVAQSVKITRQTSPLYSIFVGIDFYYNEHFHFHCVCNQLHPIFIILISTWWSFISETHTQ